MSPASNTSIAYASEAEARRRIACATLKLRRYRLARDRAQMQRLKASPRLALVIAALLRSPD